MTSYLAGFMSLRKIKSCEAKERIKISLSKTDPGQYGVVFFENTILHLQLRTKNVCFHCKTYERINKMKLYQN